MNLNRTNMLQPFDILAIPGGVFPINPLSL